MKYPVKTGKVQTIAILVAVMTAGWSSWRSQSEQRRLADGAADGLRKMIERPPDTGRTLMRMKEIGLALDRAAQELPSGSLEQSFWSPLLDRVSENLDTCESLELSDADRLFLVQAYQALGNLRARRHQLGVESREGAIIAHQHVLRLADQLRGHDRRIQAERRRSIDELKTLGVTPSSPRVYSVPR